MAKAKQAQGAVPRLRFPGFQGKWESRSLSEAARITQGGTPSTNVAEYWGGDVQWITPAEMGKDVNPYVSATSRTITDEGLLSCSSDLLPPNSVILSTRAPIGHLAINVVPMAINQGCRGVVPQASFEGKFIYFSLAHSKSRLEGLGAGNTFKELSGSALKSFELAFPSLQEQQKIADCLSSLDACIGVETRKLDTLKTHKQSLMQQLFPAAGQRVPRLRFPGFSGDWHIAKLGDTSTVVRGGSPRPIDSYITRSADGLNWLKIGDVDKEAKYIERTQEKVIPAALSKTRQIHPGDLILSNSMSFGRPYISKIVSCIHDGWLAITHIEGRLDPEFLYYVLGSKVSQAYFSSAAAGSGVKNLNADGIKQLLVTFPSRVEQQKVAAFLSSLDDLIAHQSHKIAGYQQHKKGLMQGLLPDLDEHPA